MSLLNKIFGRDEDMATNAAPMTRQADTANTTNTISDTDTQAIERYRYMLKTAPPETLEQAHTEAFSKLTPEQRQQVLREMSQGIPESELPGSDDPQALARAATRAEVRQPGYMERTFGGMGMGGAPMMGGGISMGGLIGGSLLSSIAGSFIGSSIAHSFFAGPMGAGFGGHNDGPDVVNNYYGDQGDKNEKENTTESKETANNDSNTDDSGDFDLADMGMDGFGDNLGGLDI